MFVNIFGFLNREIEAGNFVALDLHRGRWFLLFEFLIMKLNESFVIGRSGLIEKYILVVVHFYHSIPFAETRQNIYAEHIKIFVSNITALASLGHPMNGKRKYAGATGLVG